jgi:hypothetical protein
MGLKDSISKLTQASEARQGDGIKTIGNSDSRWVKCGQVGGQ